jgi:hypothetical protein
MRASLILFNIHVRSRKISSQQSCTSSDMWAIVSFNHGTWRIIEKRSGGVDILPLSHCLERSRMLISISQQSRLVECLGHLPSSEVTGTDTMHNMILENYMLF